MLRFSLFFFLSLSICTTALKAQQSSGSSSSIPANIDFSTVNVDNLSDQQLQALLQKAQQNGMSIDDIIQQAQAKGMPQDQLDKLRQRLTLLNAGGSTSSPSLNQSGNNQASNNARQYNFELMTHADSVKAFKQLKEEEFRKRIYGYDLFNNQDLTFEPNLNIPTPGNYVIGAGDEIIVDVFGYSEKNDKLKVSPEGYISIPNVGPVLVTGLTMDEAKVRITKKLMGIYSGIAAGNTYVQVLLGDIRSIRILVIGEIMKPGSYTIPSLATVANALYVSGGPNVNGSFRNIEVVRDGKTLVTFDLYDFLQNGSLSKNVLLQDQDVIKVNPYKTRVDLEGQVKHPAIFEAKDGETVQNILDYAGGYSSYAYRGFIRASRINGKEREILTIPGDSLAYYKVQGGDSLYVDSVLNRFSNRVIIGGAVFHPGEFALDSGMTVKDVIEKADGLKEDALMSRGLIKRLKPDFSPEVLSFDVSAVMSGKDVEPLKREDSVIIYSRLRLREPYYVIVKGEVNKPDTVPFAEGMKVEDAILMAGGLKDAASLSQVEVARRATFNYYRPTDTSIAIVERLAIQKDLSKSAQADTFNLQPFDQIMVRHSAGYHELIVVNITGEVVYPGAYVLDSKTERLSDLISKAGGVKPEAFVEGSLMMRRPSKLDEDFQRNKLEVFAKANAGNDTAELKAIKSKYDSSQEQVVGINLM
jgi:protein involved in polysaccharide export with SLBB domain